MDNCKNCGAPITDSKCPYCGTYHYDLTVLDVGNPGYLKIKTPAGIIEGFMYLNNATVNFQYGDILSGRDLMGNIYRVQSSPTANIELDLICTDNFKVTRED